MPASARAIERKMHQTIAKITQDFEGRWHFNTCIAAIMEFVNELYAAEEAIAKGEVPQKVLRDAMRNLVLMLAPFAPFLAAESWATMGEKGDLLRYPWPKFDPALIKLEEIELVVQVNGKIKTRLTVAADADEATVRRLALEDERVQSAIAGKQIAKVIVIAGKLVNIVVR
jgi:leucyl-tRNA synthetase